MTHACTPSLPRLAGILLAALAGMPAAAHAQHEHANPARMVPASAPAQARASSARLEIRDERERREMVIEVGPVDLPAGGGDHGGGHGDHGGVPQPGPLEGVVPLAGWLRGFRVELVDADGRPVPQAVVHHVNVIVPDRRELFSQIMLRVAAAGEETAPAVLPRELGYRVHGGERLLVVAMFHNPTGRDYRGVRLRVVMPYVPEGTRYRPTGIMPFYMDVMPPAGIHAYDLKPGRSEQSWEGRPAVDGRVIAIGGHLHTYGEVLRLEDVTAGRVLWEGRPGLDAEGKVVAMPIDKFPFGIRLRRDHVYRLTAVYDNPTGRMIPQGAMGALGGVFIPAPGQPWPGVSADDPEYQLDLRTQMRKPDGGEGGGHEH